jgi:hypothetical protein
MSLARKHKARAQQKQAQQSTAAFQPVLNSAELTGKKPLGALPEALKKLKDGFDGDRQTLKLLNGDEQRTPFKKELIEKYRPLCEYFMANYDDWARLDCLFWWLIWRSDIENFSDIEGDLYSAVQHGLTTPIKGFERDWQTFYADLVFIHFDENLKVDKSGDELCLSKLVADIINGDIIINIPLKAKLFAVYGKVCMRLTQPETAIKAFKMALALNDKVGVKKLLLECEAVLESAQPTTSEPMLEPLKTETSETGEDHAQAN